MSELNANVRPAPTGQKAGPAQPGGMLPRPVIIDTAFDDPDLMEELIHRNGPYTHTAARFGPKRVFESVDPWFRGTLAANEQPLVDGIGPILANPHFTAAAKECFQAQIVRPLSVTLNINAPMEAGKKHTDTPFFRGVTERTLSPIRYPMGASGLFGRWEVQAASAISWFYTGTGGDLDYWPDGADQPFATIPSNVPNIALVSDNERMFHRVHAIGDAQDYMADGVADLGMKLWRVDDGWEIRDTGVGTVAYRPDQIRTSVLWKAYVFETAEAERAFDNHEDDLTPDMIVDIFSSDLDRRGISHRRPTDPFADGEWLALLARTYPVAYLS